jgi:hypothetical protein
MNALAEIGPVLPSRAVVRAMARELQVLAARAVEFSGSGPTADLQLALRQFERIRAILGECDEDNGPQARVAKHCLWQNAERPPAAQASLLAGSEESRCEAQPLAEPGGCPRPAREGKERV